MKYINNIKFLAVSLLAIAFTMNSCVRKSFDAPPDSSYYDPMLPVTHTIAQLKAMNGPYTSTTVYSTTTITQDVTVAGVVTADDRSGNYYKQIVIQDSTGGITINIDDYSLYTHYPVGRKVYIKCKGMTLGYDGGLPVMGLGINPQKQVLGLESTDIDAHIIRADIGHAVQDTVISFATARAANPFFYNRLVTVTDVEFADTTLQYTDSSATTNRYLVQCAATGTGTTLVTRNSNYANFHTIRVPSGHGSVTGIFTVYQTSATNKTAQIVIRDTTDVKLTATRCGGGSVNPGNGSLITIDSLRKLYAGTGTTTLGSYKISGVVISDIDNKNVSTGNFIIEDNSHKGVIMYISGSSAYKLGDSVTVDVTGATLKLYAGALEMDGVTASKVTTNATGKSIAPVTVTIAALNAAFSTYESTLVKIVAATASGGTIYSSTAPAVTLTDASGGTLQLYTGTTATFASQPVQTSPKTYVGIPTPFNATKELKIRNLTDVQ